MKKMLTAIGGATAFMAGIIGAYIGLVPDQSASFEAQRPLIEDKATNIVASIFGKRKEAFGARKRAHKRLSAKQLLEIIKEEIAASDRFEQDIDDVVGYLDRVASCSASWKCRVSNIDGYTTLYIRTWGWIAPYVESLESTTPGFGKATAKHVGKLGTV